MYDLVLDLNWRRVEQHLYMNPLDAAYQDEDTLETPLYVACQYKAPVHVVRALLKAFPQATTLFSKRHGDLPIHIACRCQSSVPVLEVLMKAAPETILRRTRYGSTVLTALWEGRETVGRLANASYHSSFWKKADAVLRTIARQRQGQHDITSSSSSSPSPDQPLLVHAAVSMGSLGCPLEILEYCLHQHADQVFVKDSNGCLPLHVALGGGSAISSTNSTMIGGSCVILERTMTTTLMKHPRNSRRQRRLYLRYKTVHGQAECTVLKRLLQLHPNAAKSSFTRVHEEEGQLPLHVALRQGHTWKEGIHELWRAAPDVLAVTDPITDLYPFQLAALHEEPQDDYDDEQETDLDTVFCLLRASPAVLLSAITQRVKPTRWRAVILIDRLDYDNGVVNKSNRKPETEHHLCKLKGENFGVTHCRNVSLRESIECLTK